MSINSSPEASASIVREKNSVCVWKFLLKCLGDIFQHLSGKELLKCTEVSPKWEDYVGSTTACMAKIQFNTWRLESFEDSSVPLAMIHRRKYLNFIMNEPVFAFNAIIEQRTLCKRVQLNGFSISIDLFLKTLNVLSFDIEELVLHSIELTPKKHHNRTESTNEFFHQIDKSEVSAFDKLKTLKITMKLLNFSLDYIRAPKLKVVHLSSQQIGGPAAVKSIRHFLHTLPELRDIRINGTWFRSIFTEYERDFPFQLDSISLGEDRDLFAFLVNNGNFRKFLLSQKRIRKFELNHRLRLETIEMIFRMETLKELTIRIFPFFMWTGLREKSAKLQNLEYLDIITLDCSYEDRIKAILSLCPGLKYLRMQSIHTSIASFIQGNLKQIRKIRLLHRQDANVVALLPHVAWE